MNITQKHWDFLSCKVLLKMDEVEKCFYETFFEKMEAAFSRLKKREPSSVTVWACISAYVIGSLHICKVLKNVYMI